MGITNRHGTFPRMNRTPILWPLVRNWTGRMRDQIRPAIVMLVLLDHHHRPRLPAGGHGHRPGAIPPPGQRQPDREGWAGRRLGADRPAVRRSPLLLGPAVGDGARSRTTRRLPPARTWVRATRPWKKRCKARIDALRAADPGNTRPIPVDLVTASASGLDPHISVAAALYQVPRVARERGLTEDEVEALVRQLTAGRQLGVLGEPRVNVLNLNLALDAVQ